MIASVPMVSEGAGFFAGDLVRPTDFGELRRRVAAYDSNRETFGSLIDVLERNPELWLDWC